MQVTVGTSFQKIREIGFWALQVVSAVPETTDDFLPGVGSSIVCPIRGGFSIGQETLNRAFTAHTLTLPAGAAIVSLLHFLLIRKQSVSGPLWRCWRCHVDLAQNWVCSAKDSFSFCVNLESTVTIGAAASINAASPWF